MNSISNTQSILNNLSFDNIKLNSEYEFEFNDLLEKPLECLYTYLNLLKQNDKKIIAFLTHEFVPIELISFTGAIPLPLIFAGEEDLFSAGSSYLTTSMCQYALSMIGAFDNSQNLRKFKFLNLVDGIISSNYCVTETLSTEWISDLRKIKKFIVHIPYLQKDYHSNFYGEELKRLMYELLNFTNSKTIKELNFTQNIESVKKYLELYENLKELYKLPIPYSIKLKINHLSKLFGPDLFSTKVFKELISTFQKSNNLNIKYKKKLALIGASFFYGDILINIIEDAGGLICADLTWLNRDIDSFNFVYFENDKLKLDNILNLKSIDELVKIYIDRFNKIKISPHNAYEKNPLNNFINSVEVIMKKLEINSIINHIIKFCDLTGHHRQEVKNLLQSKGFQVLNLERDFSNKTIGQLKTRIEAFLEMI